MGIRIAIVIIVVTLISYWLMFSILVALQRLKMPLHEKDLAHPTPDRFINKSV